ncbi:MAG: glycosyltransferase family 2 protein, partial [Actinomycetes bacterium]
MSAVVAVAVSTYRRPELLSRLLAALEAQSVPLEQVEVVVVDDASGDATWGVLQHAVEHSPLRLTALRQPVNGGPAAGRERAWRATTAPVIAFTDDDCRPVPQWLAEGLAAMTAHDPAVVVGRTVPDPEQE